MPCSGAHYKLPSRPNKGVPPPSGNHLQNKEFSVQYAYNPAARKMKNKQTAGKSKWQTINIKVTENKTRIRIKINEFYKWCSSNTVDIRSARSCLFRRYFGSFFFLDFNSGSFSYTSDEKASKYSLKIFRSRQVAWNRQSDPISVFQLQMKDIYWVIDDF